MLAGALVVPPQYRQVAVWNVDDYDYPEMVAGVPVVATDTAVVASTRADWAGDGPQNVTVSVWLGATPTADPNLRRRFAGVMRVGPEGVRAGNMMSGNVFDIDVPEGDHRVEVWANTIIGGPSLIDFRFPEIGT
jgi:hypothetical protein